MTSSKRVLACLRIGHNHGKELILPANITVQLTASESPSPCNTMTLPALLEGLLLLSKLGLIGLNDVWMQEGRLKTLCSLTLLVHHL